MKLYIMLAAGLLSLGTTPLQSADKPCAALRDHNKQPRAELSISEAMKEHLFMIATIIGSVYSNDAQANVQRGDNNAAPLQTIAVEGYTFQLIANNHGLVLLNSMTSIQNKPVNNPSN